CEPLGTSDTNNRGSNARIAQRELQRRRCQRQAIALTSLLHLPGTLKQLGRGLTVHIARVGARPFRQETTSIRTSVHSCDSPACGHVPEWLSLSVHQREAVMRNGRLKEASLDKADHDINWATGNP